MSKTSLLSSLCLVVCLGLIARAADDSSTKSTDAKMPGAKAAADPNAKSDASAKTDAGKAAAAAADEKLKGRLPSNYLKVGVGDAQKQKIYSLHASYGTPIDALRKQLNDLEAKRDAEIRNVLTDDQKKKLDELAGGASKTKAAKKASAADAKVDAKTDAKTDAKARAADAKAAATSK